MNDGFFFERSSFWQLAVCIISLMGFCETLQKRDVLGHLEVDAGLPMTHSLLVFDTLEVKFIPAKVAMGV